MSDLLSYSLLLLVKTEWICIIIFFKFRDNRIKWLILKVIASLKEVVKWLNIRVSEL